MGTTGKDYGLGRDWIGRRGNVLEPIALAAMRFEGKELGLFPSICKKQREAWLPSV
jgi:hypothetical protein